MNDKSDNRPSVHNLLQEKALRDIAQARLDVISGVTDALDAARRVNVSGMPLDRLREFITTVQQLKTTAALFEPNFVALQRSEEKSLGRKLTDDEARAFLLKNFPSVQDVFII